MKGNYDPDAKTYRLDFMQSTPPTPGQPKKGEMIIPVVLGLVYLGYAVRIYAAYSDRLARACFRYSIVYLAALFAALLLDHYLA